MSLETKLSLYENQIQMMAIILRIEYLIGLYSVLKIKMLRVKTEKMLYFLQIKRNFAKEQQYTSIFFFINQNWYFTFP